MKVEQLMTKEVFTCEPGDTLSEVARIMWERDCGAVPIVEDRETRRMVGIVTDRDACMAAYTKGLPLSHIRVADVMTTELAACRAGEDVHDVEKTMRAAQVHRLPVLDDANQLLGVISLADLAREAAREAGTRRHAVTAADVGVLVADISRPRDLAA